MSVRTQSEDEDIPLTRRAMMETTTMPTVQLIWESDAKDRH